MIRSRREHTARRASRTSTAATAADHGRQRFMLGSPFRATRTCSRGECRTPGELMMRRTTTQRLGGTLLVVTAALASACAREAPMTAVATAANRGSLAVDDVSDGNRLPDLTACP